MLGYGAVELFLSLVEFVDNRLPLFLLSFEGGLLLACVGQCQVFVAFGCGKLLLFCPQGCFFLFLLLYLVAYSIFGYNGHIIAQRFGNFNHLLRFFFGFLPSNPEIAPPHKQAHRMPAPPLAIEAPW